MPANMPVATPLPVGAAIAPKSLRATMESRRARGERFTLSETLALLVPLCIDIGRRHAAGESLFVYPS
jgi:eukaryotic-like serine/threonine-protein kinase